MEEARGSCSKSGAGNRPEEGVEAESDEGQSTYSTIMDPKCIKFSRDTISACFTRRPILSRGANSARGSMRYSEVARVSSPSSLEETLASLRSGSKTVSDIPPIRVVKHEGSYYSLDNRRLWVFKSFGHPIPVILEEPSRDFYVNLGTHDGETVRIVDHGRTSREGESRLSFANIVLRWTLEQITDETMYASRVEPIPRDFPDLESYYKAFRYPLLEEMRGSLQASLEAIGSAPHMTLGDITENSGRDTEHSLRRLEIWRETDGEDIDKKCTKGGGEADPWKPKTTDFVIICTTVPGRLEDLHASRQLHFFALLNTPDKMDDGTEVNPLKATVYLPSASPEYEAILEGKRRWYAVYLDNLTTGKRIWEALTSIPSPEDVRSPLGTAAVEERMLVKETLYRFPQDFPATEALGNSQDGLKRGIEDYCKYRLLNDSQTNAVRSTVLGLVEKAGPLVRLIQGPPGTGKTSTVTSFLSIISSLTQRTLVCAPTNRAVCEIAERFLRNLQEDVKNCSQFADFMSTDATGSSYCRPEVYDVVVVGNEDRMNTEGSLKQIFLPLRTKRLNNALGPWGWHLEMQQVLQFISDVSTEYDVYKDLWSEKPEKEKDLLNPLQFVQKRMKDLGENFITYGQALCDDLPGPILPSLPRKCIRECCLLFEELLQAFNSGDLRDADVKHWSYSCQSVEFSSEETCQAGIEICSLKKRLIHLLGIVSKNWDSSKFLFLRFAESSRSSRIQQICLEHAKVVFSTSSSAGQSCMSNSGTFNYLVVDEAAQLVEAETAIATGLPGIERALLVGDPQQLQAMVTSQRSKDCGYGRSLFERLQRLGHPVQMLNIQYRMHPSISHFPSNQFYHGELQNGANVLAEEYKKPYQEWYGPYAVIDVEDGQEEPGQNGKSWTNAVEAGIVLHLLKKIREENSGDLDVGVITPYSSQVDTINKGFHKKGSGFLIGRGNVNVEVKTVDGFQGGERDLIIFSAVRANKNGRIGFLKDFRRLNVALTRARYCLWIVGRSSTLAGQDPLWKNLIEDAKSRGCFIPARSDDGLRKTIVHVTRDIEQFASLLEHDSILFNEAIWKIVFSKEFKDTVTKLKPLNRQSVLNAVLNLANGRRSTYSKKTNAVSEEYSGMIHVQKTAGLLLVWTVDIDRVGLMKQLIKVWDVVDYSHLQGLIRRLEAAFSTYTSAYLKKCATEKFQKIGNRETVIPATWKAEDNFKWYKATELVRERIANFPGSEFGTAKSTDLERSSVEESILLMKFYPLTSGVASQLLRVVDGSEIEFPFVVSEEQATMNQNPGSIFILGRSGTGKTTVITTRLLEKEQHFRSTVKFLIGDAIKESAAGEKAKMDEETFGGSGLRQIVVTLSTKLCAAVQHHIGRAYRTMIAGEAGSVGILRGEEDVMLDEEEESKFMEKIPDTLVNINPELFPLVLPFRKLLAMIDGSVRFPFFPNHQLTKSLAEDDIGCPDYESPSSSEKGNEISREHQTLIGADSDNSSDFDLDGEDLELDEVSENESSEDMSGFGWRRSSMKEGKAQKLEVTFEHFLLCYWPHFSQSLVKQFDASAIFTEIISFIKGSAESLHSVKGRLSREQYLSLSERKASTFDQRQRDTIYSIFMQYEKVKSQRNEYDIADYCMHLYTQMNLGNYLGLKFHYIYVDEVQDLTMAQISLFKYLCSNIKDGFVFAGDTAQTIARGVSFRFQDVRSLYYTEFLGRSQDFVGSRCQRNISNGSHREPRLQHEKPAGSISASELVGEYAAIEELGRRAMHKKDLLLCIYFLHRLVRKPFQHYMSRGWHGICGIEYRARPQAHMAKGALDGIARVIHEINGFMRTSKHDLGIVRVANSVVQLIHHFFPNSVDRLPPESSLLDGDIPIFLEKEESKELVTSLFGHGGATGGGGSEFGAEQVILVRDTGAKQELSDKLGKKALVMTVHDCKGLEFQDVLLYNFFSDSLLENKWRVIYSYLFNESSSKNHQEGKVSFPCFEMHKHNLLLSELKQLYVVVTRARQRLWIYDDCAENYKPMLDYWIRGGLIEVKRLDQELIELMQGRSTPDEWKKRGIKMFHNHQYDMAQLSFERAGNMFLANWAKAAGLQQSGYTLLRTGDTRSATQHLKDAAALFISLEKGEAAAKCYLKIEDHRTAGNIYRSSCKPPRLEEAGDCFMDGRCWKEAAEMFAQAQCVKKCLSACLRGRLLDLGSSFIAQFETQNNALIHGGDEGGTPSVDKYASADKRLEELAAIKEEYFRKCASYHFKHKNKPAMMKYVQHFACINSRRSFLERRDCFDELQELEEGEGNFVKAAKIAEAKGDFMQAVNLLERAECHEKAVEKIVEHIRFDMLWGRRNNGWPARSTDETKVLLQKARDIATSSSHLLPSDLSLEIKILMSPDEGLNLWKIAKERDNKRLEIIAGRQALDNALSQWDGWSTNLKPAQEIVTDLFQVFDSVSNLLLSVVYAIIRAQKRRDTVADENLLQCSHVYLGVVKCDQPHLFVVVDGAASWLRNCTVTPLPNRGRRCQVTSNLVYSLSQAFWMRAAIDIVMSMERILLPPQNLEMEQLTTDAFDIIVRPKADLLRKLYLVTETLAKVCSPEFDCIMDVQMRQQKYGSIIYQLSFLCSPRHSMQNLMSFRRDTGQTFDCIAGNLLEMLYAWNTCSIPISSTEVLQGIGKIVVLLPLLSKEWICKRGREITMIMPSNDYWSPLWRSSMFFFDSMLEDTGEVLRTTCAHWQPSIQMYAEKLAQLWCASRPLPSPFVFLQMLESGVVITSACDKHIHGLALPESLVINHMTGDNNISCFTSVMNASCTSHPDFQGALRLLSELTLHILGSFNSNDVFWLRDEGIRWTWYRPKVILRLIIIALTICINSSDVRIRQNTTDDLVSIMNVQSSYIREGLPQKFMIELPQIFSAQSGFKHDNQQRFILAPAFARALRAIEDPLIVLKRARLRIPLWIYHLGLPVRVVDRIGDARSRTFDSGYSIHVEENQIARPPGASFVREDPPQKKTLIEIHSHQTAGLNTENDLEKPVNDLPGSHSEGSEEHMLASEEQFEETEDGLTGEDFKVQDFDIPRDTLAPGQVKMADGQIISQFVKMKLLELAENVRQSLQEELSSTARYQRNSRTHFRSLNIQSNEYCETFLSEACPLKAETDDWLELLDKSVQTLKSESNKEHADGDPDLLDDLYNSQDELQTATEMLNSRNEKHREENLHLLRGTLEEVTKLLKSGKQKLEGRIRELTKYAARPMQQISTSKGEEDIPAVKRPGQKKPKKTKPRKKKGRK